MLSVLTQNWWTLAVRGAIAVLFGILAFIWPLATALAAVILLAAFAFVDGILALVCAFGWGLAGLQRFALVLMGLLGLAVGIGAAVWPHITALAIIFLVAGWAIVTGVLQVTVALEMRKHIENEWLLVLSGIVSVTFGVLLFLRPVLGIITLTWLFGAYALAYGIILLGLGFRVRSLKTRAA